MLKWLVRIEPLGDHVGQRVSVRLVEATHGAAAIVAVLSEWDSGNTRLVRVSAEEVW